MHRWSTVVQEQVQCRLQFPGLYELVYYRKFLSIRRLNSWETGAHKIASGAPWHNYVTLSDAFVFFGGPQYAKYERIHLKMNVLHR